MPQRSIDQLVRGPKLILREVLRSRHFRRYGCGVCAGQVAEDEGPDHVVVRDAGQVTRSVQTGYRGPGVLVNPDSGSGMPTAQADFGDVHLNVVRAVVVAAVGVERSPGGTFGGVQYVLQRGQRLVGQVRHLEVDGTAGGVDLAFD